MQSHNIVLCLSVRTKYNSIEIQYLEPNVSPLLADSIAICFMRVLESMYYNTDYLIRNLDYRNDEDQGIRQFKRTMPSVETFDCTVHSVLRNRVQTAPDSPAITA